MTTSKALLLLWFATQPAESVDSILEQTWQRAQLKPAPVSDDATFLRRVTLDIVGRIPTIEEYREFVGNPDRSAKIEQLLQSDGFNRFWSEVWTASLVGYFNGFGTDREVLRIWLQRAIEQGLPYDRWVTKLISSRGSSAFDGPANFLVRHREDPVVKVTRMFLGIRLDCARCHSHPFDRWTRDDFASMRRFFAATVPQEVGPGNIRLVNEFLGEEVEDRPRFLTGATVRTSQWRDELALFITNSKPFARTYANRLWYHFMGRGIVHPPDNFSRSNPAAVPGLLKFLTDQAVASAFKLRPMIRTICNSKAYQLDSIPPRQVKQTEAARVFACQTLRPLVPEQVYDSIVVALGQKPTSSDRRDFIRRSVGEALDEDFSDTWCYRETVQGLMVRLNGRIAAPSSAVEELYLRVLSRKPSAGERAICQGHDADDIVFALINSNEFFFNH